MFKAIVKTVTNDTYYEMEYKKVKKIEVIGKTKDVVLSEIYNKYYGRFNIAEIEIKEITE